MAQPQTIQQEPSFCFSMDLTNRETLLSLGYSPDELLDLPDGRTVINFRKLIDQLYNPDAMYKMRYKH